MLPIAVTGRDDRITTRHKKHAEEKIGKLGRYFNGIVKIDATLGHDGANQAEAELLISVQGGKPLVCHSRSKDLYAAIDMVIDKAEVKLTRHKEKLQARKGASHKSAARALRQAGGGEPDDEAYQDIVERRSYP